MAFGQDYSDTASLLSPENVDRAALTEYARDAADFATGYALPSLEFAVNHYGQADVAMFDFTSMYAADNACRLLERRGHWLLQGLVGDCLLEVRENLWLISIQFVLRIGVQSRERLETM